MRHVLAKALVQRLHVEMNTFHLSRGEYAVLPLDWTTILGLRFGGEQVLTKLVRFAVMSEFLVILCPFTWTTRVYFGPTDKPQICMQWLKMNIP